MEAWRQVWDYECFGETVDFAEGLGWVNPLDKYDSFEDVDPSLIDESEVNALDFIKEKGYAVRMYGQWW